MIRLCILHSLCILLFSIPLLGQENHTLNFTSKYTVENLPNPKLLGQDHYVSNPDFILYESTVARLDQQFATLEKKYAVELVVVMVDDFQGTDDFGFALRLFNHWGIGKKGFDNGLLLFISKKQRVYRFISGYGMESILPDVTLKRIGEQYLVPYFKEGDYDQGILGASDALEQVIAKGGKSSFLSGPLSVIEPRNTDSTSFSFYVAIVIIMLYAWAIVRIVDVVTKPKVSLFKRLVVKLKVLNSYGPFVLGIFCCAFFSLLISLLFIKQTPYVLILIGIFLIAYTYKWAWEHIQTSYCDSENRYNTLISLNKKAKIALLISPLAWYFRSLYSGIAKEDVDRLTAPDDSGTWTRINRDEYAARIDKFLSAGQLKEEALGSRKYAIWQQQTTNNIAYVVVDEYFEYAQCPKCSFRTLSENVYLTLEDDISEGKRKRQKCDFCNFCGHRVAKGELLDENMESLIKGMHDNDKFTEEGVLASITFTRDNSPKRKGRSWVLKDLFWDADGSGGSSFSGGSSGGGGSSSGGGGSSGGGSFGGGSSGGGGAGGKW